MKVIKTEKYIKLSHLYPDEERKIERWWENKRRREEGLPSLEAGEWEAEKQIIEKEREAQEKEEREGEQFKNKEAFSCKSCGETFLIDTRYETSCPNCGSHNLKKGFFPEEEEANRGFRRLR